MKMDQVYMCRECGLEMKVVKECTECGTGNECGCGPCTFVCCDRDMSLKG